MALPIEDGKQLKTACKILMLAREHGQGGNMRTDSLTPEERATVELAIGRIFRMGSRPSQPGDEAEYDRCRGIVLDLLADDRKPGNSQLTAPWPGWNFGSENRGVIE